MHAALPGIQSRPAATVELCGPQRNTREGAELTLPTQLHDDPVPTARSARADSPSPGPSNTLCWHPQERRGRRTGGNGGGTGEGQSVEEREGS
eukprot:8526089-Alexandrium_andersonii.AAC.1